MPVTAIDPKSALIVIDSQKGIVGMLCSDIVPIDAVADLSPEAHTSSITRVFPRISETGTAGEIIALLETVKEKVGV